LATGSSPQRAYRAACPNCGAPVEFASAASASAVCSFCRSTLVRDGEALRRIGVSAELFDDHSPLQLGAGGRAQGVAFTLIGRLQYGYATRLSAPAAASPASDGAAAAALDGTWNEWHALFDNGRSGWLSEDNGAYVLAFDGPTPDDAPRAGELRAGERCVIDGRGWQVASVVRARLIAAQGELPSPPRLEGDFNVVDLRNEQGEVATLDYADPARVHWSTGRSVALSTLALQGLREVSEKTLGSRAIECPSCGAALEPRLASTKSLSCHQCQAVVDISAGVGADLHYYAQNNSGDGGLEPQLPLGSTGTLALAGAPLPWQVVGYMERCDLPEADSDDEQTFWREYLLYHRTEGFAFLVDAQDGWSWVRPLTGAPQARGGRATWQGEVYRHQYTYEAKVTWVLGEFYWRVRREERATVSDYQSVKEMGRKRLSREKTAAEVTWSGGETLPAATVADAFKLPPSQRAALQRDVVPMAAASAAAGMSRAAIVAMVIFLLMVAMTSQCSEDRCDDLRTRFGQASTEYQQCVRNRGSGGFRSGGGSFGGYSSGGGHK
jgi:hypothetical protein